MTEPQTPQEQYEDDRRRMIRDAAVTEFDKRWALYVAKRDARNTEAKKHVAAIFARRKTIHREDHDCNG